MPELPEVETIRRQLCEAGLEGRLICVARVLWSRTVEPFAPEAFCEQVGGRRILRILRHGKWLIFALDDGRNLLVHLRMTGGFHLTQGCPVPGRHDRLILELEGGLNLHFRDPRKFGRWRLGGWPAELGPDALSVTAAEFTAGMDGRNKAVKALLLDQAFVAGVGNIYADEALFTARIDPRRCSATLSAADTRRLWQAVRKVIEAGVLNGGTSLGDGQGNYTDLKGASGGHQEKVKVYGRAGLPCAACGQPLCKTVVAQRGTVYCPGCQR